MNDSYDGLTYRARKHLRQFHYQYLPVPVTSTSRKADALYVAERSDVTAEKNFGSTKSNTTRLSIQFHIEYPIPYFSKYIAILAVSEIVHARFNKFLCE